MIAGHDSGGRRHGRIHDRSGDRIGHPSKEADAPRLEFRPARGQRAALLEVPAELEGLEPRELHAAVAVKLHKKGQRLAKRKR